jgi:hypothetical protein
MRTGAVHGSRHLWRQSAHYDPASRRIRDLARPQSGRVRVGGPQLRHEVRPEADARSSVHDQMVHGATGPHPTVRPRNSAHSIHRWCVLCRRRFERRNRHRHVGSPKPHDRACLVRGYEVWTRWTFRIGFLFRPKPAKCRRLARRVASPKNGRSISRASRRASTLRTHAGAGQERSNHLTVRASETESA